MNVNSRKDNFMRRLTVAFVLILSVTMALVGAKMQNQLLAAPAQQNSAKIFHSVIDRLVDAINREDYLGIRRDFGKGMQQAFPPEKSTPFFTNVLAQYGKIRHFDTPRIIPPNQAISVAHCERGILDIKLILDSRNKIAALWFLPHKPDIPVPEKHQTGLALPFKGRWLVLWGGDTEQLNQHHKVPNQRFAFDFLGADEKGRTRRGNGLKNEQFFAFGRDILAPADGVVTDVISGVRDNAPGSMNPYSAIGNAVFIQHRANEVSVLAHLKLGSITVNVGDKIKTGQIIALCGNSGNSSEPHLHYHLQNTPIIQDGTGIKCYFRKISVIEDGKKQPKENHSPIKGQIITAD